MTQEPRPIVEIKQRCQASALEFDALSRSLRSLAATVPAPADTGEAAVRWGEQTEVPELTVFLLGALFHAAGLSEDAGEILSKLAEATHEDLREKWLHGSPDIGGFDLPGLVEVARTFSDPQEPASGDLRES